MGDNRDASNGHRCGIYSDYESTWINNMNVSVWRQKLNVFMSKLCLSNHQICGYPNTPQFHASPLHWVYIGIYIGHYSPYPAIEWESSCKSLKHTHNANDVLVRYFLPLGFYTPWVIAVQYSGYHLHPFTPLPRVCLDQRMSFDQSFV